MLKNSIIKIVCSIYIQSLQDFAIRLIYRKSKQTPQFSQELANFRNCPVTSSQRAFSQRKVVSQFEKKGQPCVLFMPDLQELHWTNEPKAKRIRSTPFSLSALKKTVICSAALDHATPLYTALGDTVKKAVEFTAESITSLSNLVRSFQIQRIILLKLQTSEQTPLMWKPVESLFNKHITTIHHGFNIVKLQEQLVAEMA